MFNVMPITLPRPIFIFFFISLSIFFCHPADPDYKKKPLANETYTGFVSREFFQAVVTIEAPETELSLKQMRNSCKEQVLYHRDATVLPILVAINQEAKNEIFPSNKYLAEEDEIKSMNPTENIIKFQQPVKKNDNPLYFRRDFAWFLDSMQIYLEDYSRKDKCIFIFRKIEPDLLKKVENAALSR